ncbi:MAG: methyltransferase domain-containing protein [Candidatus Stahlbacteria bacterium]|nr:methyltransferase domain-containing protein [Candidatus Stahlbacteria bacterium]
MFIEYIRKSPHRNELERYIKKYFPLLKGKILEIGSKDRRYDFLLKDKPIAMDIVENKQKEVIFGDVNELTFTDNSFDVVLCIEVFEYLSTYKMAISEIYRVLKNGGIAILSIPFMYKIHGDKLRFTSNYLTTELLNCFLSADKQKQDIKIYPIGNFYTIILDIVRDKVGNIRIMPIRYVCYLGYLFLTLFIPLTKLSKDTNYVSGYFIVVKKSYANR